MATCRQCNATVPDEKAFCQECGASMAAQATEQQRATPPPNLGATVVVPPSQWPSAPPVTPASAPRPPQPAAAPPTPAAAPTPTQPPARAATTTQAQRADARTTNPIAPAPPAKGGNRLALMLLAGAVIVLLIILALVLLNN
ncbi:MAG TPA: hypothetical protein VF525_18780 [Pyrinomonadaceae bacterium]